MELPLALAALLLAGVLPALWVRRASLTLVDLFLLAIAMYFGAYTLVDAVSTETPKLNSPTVVAEFLVISIGASVLWFSSRGQAFGETSLARLQIDWRACPATPIVGIVALALWFRWYTAVFFSDFGALDENKLAALEQDLPYWYTSVGMIVGASIFPAAICSWGKLEISRGWRRLFWLGMTGASALLILGMGRRAMLTFLIVVGWTVLARLRRERRGWIALALIVLSMPALLALSNVYQAYRAASYRGVLLENVVVVDDVGSILQEAAAVNRTVSNLQERQAMWRFNYEVMDAHLSEKASLQWGALLVGELPNYVPAVLNRRKQWVDSEDVLLQRFDLEPYDRASNLFAYTYADFGMLAAVATPALMLLFAGLCALALRGLRDPFLRTLLMGMAISHALSLETSYLWPIALARDFAIVALVYILARSALRAARSLLRVRVVA